MAMSTDHVEFILDGETSFRTVANVDKPHHERTRAALELLIETLGMTTEEAERVVKSGSQFKIKCRPSQFARFLIRRNEWGFRNSFKDLEARLVQPPMAAPSHLIDVIKRPRSE